MAILRDTSSAADLANAEFLVGTETEFAESSISAESHQFKEVTVSLAKSDTAQVAGPIYPSKIPIHQKTLISNDMERRIVLSTESFIYHPALDHLNGTEFAQILRSHRNSLISPSKDGSHLRESSEIRAEFYQHFVEITRALIDKELIDPSREITTGSLPNLKFINAKGLVVFESWGHLAATLGFCSAAMEQTFRYSRDSKASSIILHPNATAEAGFLLQAARSAFVTAGHDSEKRLGIDRHHFNNCAQLDGMPIQVQSLEGVSKSDRGILDPFQKLSVLREVCFQSFGYIPSDIAKALAHIKVGVGFRGNPKSAKSLLRDLADVVALNADSYDAIVEMLADPESEHCKRLEELSKALVKALGASDTPQEVGLINSDPLEYPRRLSKLHEIEQRQGHPEEQLRVAQAHEITFHHPGIDELVRRPAWLGQNIYYEVFQELVKSKRLNLKNATTDSLPDLKFVDALGRVVFESFGHFLSSAFEYDRFHHRDGHSWNFKTANSDKVSSPLHLLEGLRRQAQGERDLVLPTPRGDPPASCHLRSLVQSDFSENSSFDLAAQCAAEACMQLFGGIPENPARALGNKNFLSPDGQYLVSGEVLINAVRSYLGVNWGGSVHWIQEREIARRLFMFAKHPLDSADYVKKVRKESKPIEHTPQSETEDIKDPPLPLITDNDRILRSIRKQRVPLTDVDKNSYNEKINPGEFLRAQNFRELKPGERSIHLPEIDQLLKFEVFSAEEFKSWAKAQPKGWYKEYELAAAYWEVHQCNVTEPFWKMVGSLIDQGIITDEPPYAHIFSNDLKLVDAEGRVIFESIGHMFQTAQWYNRYFDYENVRFYKYEGGSRKLKFSDSTTMEFIYRPIESNILYREVKSQEFSKKREREDSFDIFPKICADPKTSKAVKNSPEHLVQVLKEGCTQLFGRIPHNPSEALRSKAFHFHGAIAKGSTLIVNLEESLKLKPGSLLKSETRLRQLLTDEDPKTKRERRERHISQELNVPSHVYFLALCSLGLEVDSKRSYRLFNERILKNPSPAPANSVSQKKEGPLETIGALVEEGIKNGKVLDYDALARQRLVDLLKQLCYREYDGDLSKIVEELKQHRSVADESQDAVAKKVIAKLLDDVTPQLIRLFSEMRDFKDPKSLAVTLLPHEREAVTGALSFDKPLFILGPGTGKTETSAAWAEATQSTGALWVTKRGSVPDTAKRLKSGKILTDPEGVCTITATWSKKSTEQFQSYLEGKRYVIVSADTLRSMEQYAPDKFEILREWMAQPGRRKILDEAHLLDNPESGRSKAVQKLKCEKTVVATATPFQHRPERIANILHLAMPERYPDPKKLEAEFRKDPLLAQAVLRTHATIYGITDVAQYFESPEKRPFKEQLDSGMPRIPRMELKRLPYRLSLEHSRLYVDIATNWAAFSAARGLKPGSLHQLAALRQLILNPEKVAAAPALSMLDASKQVILESNDRGEKSLVLGHRLNPLKLVANDVEIKERGAVLLNGAVDPELRAHEISRLEDDATLNVVIGQVEVVGTGHNCRSVSNLLFTDRPPLVSGTIQGLGRAQRLLTKGDERFAREKVTAWFLEPQLDPKVLEEVSPERRKYLERGTIYEQWLSSDLQRLNDYNLYVSRNGAGPQVNSLSELTRELERGVRLLAQASDSGELLSRTALIGPYNNPIKNSWREEHLGRFVETHIKLLGKDPAQIKVALLPGPEALEIPIYLRAGIKPENIYAFEGSQGKRRELVRQSVNHYGARFVAGKIEHALPSLEDNFDIVSIDPDGYLTGDLLEMFTRLKLTPNALVLKNSLEARENEQAGRMVRLAGGRREVLDAALTKLIGTYYSNPHSADDEEMLKVASHTRAAARALSIQLGRTLNIDQGLLSSLLGEMHLGTRHLQSFEQLRYTSPSGQRFLSTFAALSAWQPDVRESKAAKSLREILALLVDISLKSGNRSASAEFSVAAARGRITLDHSRFGRFQFSKKELVSLIEHYSQQVSEEHRFSGLVTREVPELVAV